MGGPWKPNYEVMYEERVCPHCNSKFHKSEKYVTCGHPKCVKMQRAVSKAYRNHNIKGGIVVLADWDPPDIYAPNTVVRERVWNTLKQFEGRDLTPSQTSRLMQKASIKLNQPPGVVLGVWKSLKSERENARRQGLLPGMSHTE